MANHYSIDLPTAMSLFSGAEEELKRQIKEKLREQAEVVIEEAAQAMVNELTLKMEIHQHIAFNRPVIHLTLKDKPTVIKSTT